MRTIKVRKLSFDRLSVKTCRRLFIAMPAVRHACQYWCDGSVYDLLDHPQFLRRLVIRSLKEYELCPDGNQEYRLCPYSGSSLDEPISSYLSKKELTWFNRALKEATSSNAGDCPSYGGTISE
jgi:hypothetical protein